MNLVAVEEQRRDGYATVVMKGTVKAVEVDQDELVVLPADLCMTARDTSRAGSEAISAFGSRPKEFRSFVNGINCKRPVALSINSSDGAVVSGGGGFGFFCGDGGGVGAT